MEADLPNIEAEIEALPKPVRELFRVGEVDWPADPEDWPDYAAMGLTAEHAPVLARLIEEEDWFLDVSEGALAEEDPDAEWADLHVPRALVAVAGADALPTLFEGMRLSIEEDFFGDVYTQEGERWIDACGEGGAHGCAAWAGRERNCWLEESEALGGVERWVKANPGPTADAILKRTVRRVLAAMEDPDPEDPECNGHRIDFLAEMAVAAAKPAVEAAWARGGFARFVTGSYEDVMTRLDGRTPVRWKEPVPVPVDPAAAARAAAAAAKAARAAKKKQRKRKKR